MITLEEFKKNHLDKCRLIGLDLGSKRIGVSICDEKQLIATPFITIEKKSSQNLIDQLKSIIIENNIKGIIIGNPLNMDGSSGKSSQSVKDVSTYIEKNIDILKILLYLVVLERAIQTHTHWFLIIIEYLTLLSAKT